MAEVFTLPNVSNPGAPLDAQPVETLIEDLEAILVEARAGTIRAMAAAVVRQGGVIGSFWVRPPGAEHGHDLAAAVNYLNHRYCASMMDSSR